MTRLRHEGDTASLTRLVKAGDARAVSRLITMLENREPEGLAVLQRLESPTTRATVIGMTGYPGAGKSTLIDHLAG